MNSNFSNSNFGRILYIAIITLIVAATIFVLWYMTAGYKLGTYDPNTRLGSVYIGGLTEEDVPDRLNTKINSWYNDETILFELRYQGHPYTFNRDLFFFNVETSIDLIKQGEINEIQVYYQGTDLNKVVAEIEDLEFLDNVIDNVDLQRLISDILYDASLMKSFSIKNIEDYLVDPELSIEVLQTTNLIIPAGFNIDTLVSKVLEKYPDGNIIIPSEELFDVIPLFAGVMEDSEMTILASAMLDLILETNFIINEIHPTTAIEYDKYEVVTYPYLGRNAHIYEVTNESFSFYNPNASDYYFSINDEDNTMSLSGLAFEYVISINPERIVLEYDFEQDLNVLNHQTGHDGAVYNIYRTIYNPITEETTVKIIVSEFYPPRKKIDVFE